MRKISIILTALTVSAIILTSLSCEKDDQGQRVTYYKTVGEGYIYERDNNKPIKGMKITVTSNTGISEWVSSPWTKETFTTDENGYYQIRFAKRVSGDKVKRYTIRVGHGGQLPTPPPPYHYWYWETSSYNLPFTTPNGYMYPTDIKDKKIITFDAIKYYYN